MKRLFRRRNFIALIVMMVLGVNALAFVQAWAMTHFVSSGIRTEAPEALSLHRKIWVLFTGVRVPRPTNLSDPSDFDLPFQTRHVRANNIDLETWVIPATEKPKGLVLMYHGYVSSKSSLLSAAQQFHQLGYAVELVDFRGSGGSNGNTTSIGYFEANDVAATVTDARQNTLSPDQPIILFGQSMGAAAVIRAVGDLGVTADAIIIESPYDRLVSTANNRFHAMHLPAFPLAQMLVFWGGVQQGYSGFAMNPADSAARIHCPLLMFHGQLDSRVTVKQANALFNNFAGPKRMELYNDAGHCSFLSTDPARWRQAISSTLRQTKK